uniref:DHC_N2 domain-containing protein n=1 Tax=Heterorhabditis bacteriophora TaxID=37862 RepID=A0A1I7XRM1_HETBA
MNMLVGNIKTVLYEIISQNAMSWEDKLNRISAMFDVWIDVQRRWVYLEGLFSGSADIATLLPVESARFSSISTEFLALMKKVTSSPRILDVVGMQGAQRLLERLADMLSKIQKALGEYLERERASFPRFYFVGDEDLLEIMGNSKDIARLQKHLKKMFAGVTAIDVGEEDRIITALHSREGERVELMQPVHTKDVRINDWLKAFESEMRHTLSRLLGTCLLHFAKLDISLEYMEWLDKYPQIANANFFYGFEYLGIQERLVRTPLTDRCFLTMTQALHSRLVSNIIPLCDSLFFNVII